MKKKIMTIITFIFALTIYGQVLERQVMGSSGTSISNSNNILNFTIGEPIVGNISSTNNEVRQGFWNTSASITLSTEDFTPANPNVRLYPNPVVSELIINFQEATSQNFDLEVYDITGKRTAPSRIKIGEHTTRINFQSFSNGAYLVVITPENSSNKITYRIIKK